MFAVHAQQKLLSFQWLRQGSKYSEILLVFLTRIIFLTHLYFWGHFSPSPVLRADGGNLTVGNAAGLLTAWPVKACSGKAHPPSYARFGVQGEGAAKSHMQSQEPRVNLSIAAPSCKLMVTTCPWISLVLCFYQLLLFYFYFYFLFFSPWKCCLSFLALSPGKFGKSWEKQKIIHISLIFRSLYGETLPTVPVSVLLADR